MTTREASGGPPPLRFYSFVLIVADLPAMRDWYQAVLGLKERISGGSDADGTAFVVMEGAGTCIELVSRPGAAAPVLTTVARADGLAHLDQPGWKTLDLETDDLALLDAHLRAHDVTILRSMQALSPKRAMTMIRDPEDNLIAFFGPPPA